MSTVDYKLNQEDFASAPTNPMPFDWKSDLFYTSAVVLGLDIGLEGIGVWLRKGRQPIYARTFLFETPDAAPLEGRRGLRAGRRCRQAERRREVALKKFCADFGLPWVEITDKGHDDGPFRFRWIATRKDKDNDGLRDIRAFSACLRHIIRHRGYDWHSPEDGGEYPWGEEAKGKDAIVWAKTAFCKSEHADDLRYRLSDCLGAWSEKEQNSFEYELKQAVERYNHKGLEAVLAEHFSQPKNNLCEPVRRHNFPREMVEAHLQEIVKRHPQFLGGEDKVKPALERLHQIINDHRKDEAATARLFLRKVKPCPLAAILFNGQMPKCDVGKNRHIRRFKLLEFLATRTFVRKDGTRILASADIFKWLLDQGGLLETDISALESKGQIQREPINKREFKKQFVAKQDASAKMELAGDTQSHNGEYFTQLTDLLWPKMSELGGRASLCGRSAEALFEYATQDGFEAAKIASRLKEPRFERAGKKMSFYEIRQSAAAGYGVYKQVEFLLGRWTKKGDRLGVPGKLRQVFAQLIQDKILPPDKTAPDYVVVETIGDIPRNKVQAKEIQESQKARREFKDQLRDHFKQFEDGKINREEANKRRLLYDQQHGLCPYTGKPLGENPYAADLEIDHVYPRSLGGISEMVNLVLTHRKTNGEIKREQTPYAAFGGKQNSPEWREIQARVLKMQWNGQKREFFLRSETTPPDWSNMTRMAQLARQLRYEVARWLEIADDDAEVRRRVGTPTGYQTSVCREAWSDKLPKKDRNNLRHHLWDAAVLAHIPPGKGMQQVRCHGIFQPETDQSGSIKLLALPDLGPDLNQFEKETATQCLVEKIQPAHDKKSRYQQTIYSPPDKDGVMWARDPLDKLAAKKDMAGDKLLKLLRAAGIDEKQLPASHFNAWLEKRQAQFFTREQALAAVDALALPPEHTIPAPVFEAWWTDRLKGDQKKVTEKSLRVMLVKAFVPKAVVSDQQLSGVLINRGDPGPLTRKDGTEIRGISGSASTMTPMAVIPHRNHAGETIGFKLATESFIRAEIWTTEEHDKNGEVIKDKEGKPELEYHRRLIPHPRGLKNLSLRVLQCTGKPLAWERALTDAEIVELGLNDHAEVKRLRKGHDKAVKFHDKVAAKTKNAESELTLAQTEVEIAKPKPPVITLRKIFTGLPPHAKRLTNANGVDISRFEKGDLFFVPLTPEAEICGPGQIPYREYWFRVAGLQTNGQVKLLIAERKQTKPLTDQEVKVGKQLTSDQEWLIKASLKQPGDNELIAHLLRHTHSHDQSSDSAD